MPEGGECAAAQAGPGEGANPACLTGGPDSGNWENSMGLNIGAFAAVYGMGGSQNSTVTLCNALADRGHRVTLYCPARQMFSHVRPRIELCDLPVNPWGPLHFKNVSLANIWKAVHEVRGRKHDVLLSFSPPCLFMTLPLLLVDNIPGVHYVLGPFGRFPLLKVFPGRVVANSEETRDILAACAGWPAESIPVVRARVDVDALQARDREAREDAAFAPPTGVRQIGMMSPLRDDKMPGLLQTLEAVRIVASERTDFRFLLAGEGTERVAVEAVVAKVNEEAGREVARLVGYVGDVASFLLHADIVIGVGRCAFEAMAFAKPTLIVGSSGYAGTVCPEEADDLAHFNFAGRNVRGAIPPTVLADRLRALLDDDALRGRVGRFARSYVVEQFDAALGARQFEEILMREMRRPPLPFPRRVSVCMRYVAAGAVWWAKGLAKRILRPHSARIEFEGIARTRQVGGQYCLSEWGGRD